MLALILSIGVLVGCTAQGEIKAILTGNEEQDDSKLTALVLADIRFDGSSLDDIRKNIIKDIIAKQGVENEYDKAEPYEVLVLNGNTVKGTENGKLMQDAVKFFDSLDIPWAITLGEKDIEGNTSKDDIINIIKKSKNCLIKHAEVYGANYVVDVKTSQDKFVSTMYFMDSSTPCTAEQTEWYVNMVEKRGFEYSDVAGKNVRSIMFSSKAVDKFNEADEWTHYREEVTVWEDSMQLQNELIRLKSLRGYFAGHDTLNAQGDDDASGVRWSYVRSMYLPNIDKTSEEFKNYRDNLGYMKINLSDDNYVISHNKSFNLDEYEGLPKLDK